MLAYKYAENNKKLVIITLEIPHDAITNMNRSSVVVKEKASHRANMVFVKSIEDEEGKFYTVAESTIYAPKKLSYGVGHLITEPAFDRNLEKVKAEGIHFFLDKHVVELYDREMVENGVFTFWSENGLKQGEVTFTNGEMNGLLQNWYENGQMSQRVMYKNGVMDGLHEWWSMNGSKHFENLYDNGRLVSSKYY